MKSIARGLKQIKNWKHRLKLIETGRMGVPKNWKGNTRSGYLKDQRRQLISFMQWLRR